jgi:hypothetical protein
LSVQFAPNEIRISGDAKVQKKVFGLSLVNLSIPFTSTLEPVAASGRRLQFSIRHLSIQNAEFLNLDNFQWISSTLFNHPPVVTYHNHVITIDLNAVEGASTKLTGSLLGCKNQFHNTFLT